MLRGFFSVQSEGTVTRTEGLEIKCRTFEIKRRLKSIIRHLVFTPSQRLATHPQTGQKASLLNTAKSAFTLIYVK